MSFLKKFLDKVDKVLGDDDKYGKGHRLGDSQTAELEKQKREQERLAQLQRQQQLQQQQQQQRVKSGAAQAAGQAALARIEQKQQQVNMARQNQLLKKQINSDLNAQDKELEKAQQLKEHYFGTSHETVIDKPTHVIEITFKSEFLETETCLPRKEIEGLIEEKLLDNLSQDPILTCLTLLLTANYKNQEKLDKCLEILNKLVDNIIKNQTEEKYRKIRIENEHIKQKLLTCKYVELLLDTLGFQLIQQFNEDLQQDERVYLFNINMLENLNEFKSTQTCAKPIKPELDRNIRVFTSALENDDNPMRSNNLSDDFYNLHINELKSELKQREATLEKMQMLRTKAMRERDEHLEQRKYVYCVIRIKFSNDLFLQAIFHTRETLQHLYEFVQSCLIDKGLKFDLILPAATSLLNSNKYTMDMTLAEVGLAPASMLHFKCNDSAFNGCMVLRDDLCGSVASGSS